MCISIVYISGRCEISIQVCFDPIHPSDSPPPVTSSELLYTLREKPWDLAYLSMFVLFWLIHCLQDLSFFFLQRACFSSSLCTVVLPFMSTLSYLSVAWLYPACCEQHCSNRHYTGISESRHNFLTINTMECCSRVECLQLF